MYAAESHCLAPVLGLNLTCRIPHTTLQGRGTGELVDVVVASKGLQFGDSFRMGCVHLCGGCEWRLRVGALRLTFLKSVNYLLIQDIHSLCKNVCNCPPFKHSEEQKTSVAYVNLW